MNRLLIFLLVFSLSCKQKPRESAIVANEESNVDWKPAKDYYLKHITDAITTLDKLTKLPMTGDDAKAIFEKARISFKKAEPYASYLNPGVGHRANGPALPIVTDDSQKVLLPIGLQKIEESIYEGEESEARYKEEISITIGMLRNLQNNIRDREVTPQRFFIATHQQLMRIISLSISGFDTPISQLGLNETIVSLESLKEVYTKSIQRIILDKNHELDVQFQSNIEKAVGFVKSNTNFETFDRYTFIRDYMNPITRNWVAIRKESELWNGVNNKPFNFDAPTFFEEDSFNVEFFTPAINRNPTEKKIALGKKLFFDPKLSQNGKMACVTCHDPNKAWADGIALNLDKNGKPLQRNTPTLINSAFQQSFFWDGRSPNLLDQITSVFTNDKEFDSSVHEFSTEILTDTTYISLFKDAYGGISARNTEIIRAISSYISTLNAFNSKFDKNIRSEEDTFTEEEKLGFNLYMGKALCATCHFIPLTNGTVPPFFTEHEKEVIGVPETANNKTLDDDLGFYWRHNEELEVHRGMFKTPTIRNTELTAPYMHNGIYKSLEEVINFYNLGGGGGLGFDLPYQTLPFDNLQLSSLEEKALVAFMKTLTDTKVGEVY
ncbi:cytochrome-c peroxidase [Flagellimonas hymeniacidonis]|uniref:Cytochrome-c peroxidase n=1 Tax=Flagellimonas hymeniacidonis TaxID=2603628 RepID=A0A5C8V4C2_9FLAO|nr:cytochrome c peroxidase [Flagellimonas hymeniacidonis]TXN35835.1 cytochrome-c peroxidase [Flagellimonas hymeniacidonis]